MSLNSLLPNPLLPETETLISLLAKFNQKYEFSRLSQAKLLKLLSWTNQDKANEVIQECLKLNLLSQVNQDYCFTEKLTLLMVTEESITRADACVKESTSPLASANSAKRSDMANEAGISSACISKLMKTDKTYQKGLDLIRSDKGRNVCINRAEAHGRARVRKAEAKLLKSQKKNPPKKITDILTKNSNNFEEIDSINSRKTRKIPLVEVNKEELFKVNTMAYLYEQALRDYTYSPWLKFMKGPVDPRTKSYTKWVKAVQFAEELKVPFDVYIRAQFWCINEWYNRAPKFRELSSTSGPKAAKERVRIFIMACKEGKAGIRKAVKGPSIRQPKITKSAMSSYFDQQMFDFMKNYDMSEEEIFLEFEKTGLTYLIFDKEWLKNNETYQRLKSQSLVVCKL